MDYSKEELYYFVMVNEGLFYLLLIGLAIVGVLVVSFLIAAISAAIKRDWTPLKNYPKELIMTVIMEICLLGACGGCA